jgi:DNA-binding NarL/FixJ family response regulator
MAGTDPVRVMVVDDQADVRFLVEVLLGEHADLDLVASVATAEEALEAVDRTAPDVALVDARMPLVSGFELTPRLLEARPGLRVAILTAIVDDVVEEQARAAGAARCVSKGEVDALAAIVHELAAGG